LKSCSKIESYATKWENSFQTSLNMTKVS
jgi:hypothetical protein